MAEAFDRLRAALATRYKLEREIGFGGMATVYLADDVKHHRKVAVKVLRPELAAAMGADRFLREIEIAARLTHPHILPLYDSGQAKGFLYYVMPYVEGESLRARLNRDGELPIGDAVRILREVVDALSYAHSKGVVHRDIKPDNVMISGRHALVTDFGVAKAVSEATGSQNLTTAGMALGTPAYMAPEQAAADPNIDHRVDIYAVGALAYELLAGRTVFASQTAAGMLAAQVTEKPEPVTAHRDSVPPVLAELVMKCLAKKPADRWQSADELLTPLEALATTPTGGITPTDTRPVPSARVPVRQKVWIGVFGGLALVALIGWLLTRGPSGSSAIVSVPRLAVMPFENLGLPEDEYFADGMTEETTSRLAQLSGLEVIDRRSAMRYKNAQKTTKQIGEELGVQYLLEGTVRWEKVKDRASRVRISPQLTRVSDATNLWAEPYEAALTEVFGLQRDIAERVAKALSVRLLSTERAVLGRKPTDNPEAYDSYLRGNEARLKGSSLQVSETELGAFRRAVQLDSTFALAWARLAEAHANFYWSYHDRSPARIDSAQAAAGRALRLQPNLAEAHKAQGFVHYWGRLDYDHALEEFRRAAELAPSASEPLIAIGYIYRRRGDWDSAVAYQAKGLELSPRDPNGTANLGLTLYYRREYERAARYLDIVTAIDSSYSFGQEMRALTWLASHGDVARAQGVLRAAGHRVGEATFLKSMIDDDPIGLLGRFLDDGYRRVLEDLPTWPTIGEPSWLYLDKAQAFEILSRRPDRARAYYDSARVSLEARVRARSADAKYRSYLGLAYAGLHRSADAIREGRAAVTMTPISKNAPNAVAFMEALAEIYVMVGEHEAAVQQLSELLSVPSGVSVSRLRVDPRYEPLRNDPAFQKLTATAR